MGNLAVVLSSQGKNIEAEQINRQTLQLRQKVLGLRHPDTLVSISNLAVVLGRQGKYAATEQMNQWVQQLKQEALG
jgi:hypothetical protein